MALTLITAGASRAIAEEKDAEPNADQPVSYYKQVWPIIQRHCQGCHQPARADGEFIITSYASFQKGGDMGEGFVPGKPDESLVIDYLTGKESPRMPKGKDPLSDKQIDLFRRWIAEGAKDDTPDSARKVLKPGEVPIYKAPPVITALVYAPGGEQLAVSGYREVLIHKSDGSERVTRYVGLSPRINSVEYSVDGSLLIVAGGSPGLFGEVQVWDTKSGKLQRSEMASYDTAFGASISSDNKQIVFGCADQTTRLINTKGKLNAMVLKHHNDWVFGGEFSHDGKHIVTVSRDRALKLCVAESGQFIDNITSITPGVLGGALLTIDRHPSKNWFLHGGEDGIPRIHKMIRTTARRIGDDNNLIRAFEKQPGQIAGVSFSGDGESFVVGGFSNEARVYKTGDGARIATLSGHEGSLYAVAMRPDGQQVATGGFDGFVRLYDTATGKLLEQFIPVEVAADEVAAKP